MNYTAPEKKIASPVAYLLIIAIAGTVWFFLNSQKQIFLTKARSNEIVNLLTLSNRFSSSANVSFFTKNKTQALVRYGTAEPLDQVAFEIGSEEKNFHYFTLNNLSPNTTYYYQIYLNNKPLNLNQLPSFKTQPQTISQNALAPLFGKVLNSKLQPISGVLVKVRFFKLNPDFYYSALGNENGEWIITLPYVFDKEYRSLSPGENDPIEYLFYQNGLLLSTVYSYYQNSRPLQSIILGENYNLLNSSEQILGVKINKPAKNSSLIITNPVNNSLLSNFSPVFRGVGKPNIPLNIEIKPVLEQGSIISNEFGEWRYNTQTKLLPGKYQFLIYNPAQKKEQAQIYFIIGKSGEAVLGEATGSATLTPSLPTATPLLPSPTILIENTLAPTEMAAITAVAPTTAVPSPTNVERISNLGFNNNLFILTASSLSLLGLLLILY